MNCQKGDRGGSESSRLKRGDPLSPRRGQEVKLWEATSLQEYKKPSVSSGEPEDRKSVSLLGRGGEVGWGGVESRGFQEGRRPGCFLLCSDALTCKGRGAPAPDLGFHVQNPVVRKCRGRRSLSALPADPKSLHSILYWPKRFW